MKTTLKVNGMSCNHCVKFVTESLNELDGVNSVNVSLENKSVEIEHEENVDLKTIEDAIKEAGYEVA